MNCGELREERASEGENQTKPEEQDGATLPYTLEIKKKIHLAALLQQRVAAPWGQTDKVEKKIPLSSSSCVAVKTETICLRGAIYHNGKNKKTHIYTYIHIK